MSLEMTIVMLITAWLSVASAMLWGVMRIARRHQHARPANPRPSHPVGQHKHRPGTAH